MRLGKGGLTGNIAFSPNGTRLAVGSAIGIWIYDVRPGKEKELDLITSDAWSIQSIVYSPDAIIVASRGDDGTAQLWDVVTGEQKITLEGHTDVIYALAHSPDAETLAIGVFSDNTPVVQLQDVGTGKHVATLSGHTGIIKSIAYSRDGTQIATGSDDRTVRLWDAKTGAHLATLSGHTGGVTSVAFSPDRSTVASSSQDGTILLWQVR